MSQPHTLPSTILLLLALGCGGGQGPGSGGGPSASASAGGEVDLGDFPIPAPAGGSLGRHPVPNTHLIAYPWSRFDELVAFYDDWAEENERTFAGGGVPRVHVDEDAETFMMLVLEGGKLASIAGSRADDEVLLTLSIQR